MKKNTKFLWMYICILFSFAVILIVFAGFTTNEEKGLKNKVEIVSNENNQLRKEKTALENSLKVKSDQIVAANANYNTIKTENDTLKSANETLLIENNSFKAKDANETLIAQALSEYENGEKAKCKETLTQINVDILTVSQKYLYDMMTK